MSGSDTQAHPHGRDIATGVVAMVFGGLYRQQAHSIENSLLSDAVGAGGVPGAIGGLMLLVGAGLTAKALWNLWRAPVPEDGPPNWPRHRMALSLLAVLAAYVAALPVLGYLLAMPLLMAGVAWLAGARAHRTVLLVAAVGGPLLWFTFDRVLQVRLPAGLLGA